MFELKQNQKQFLGNASLSVYYKDQIVLRVIKSLGGQYFEIVTPTVPDNGYPLWYSPLLWMTANQISGDPLDDSNFIVDKAGRRYKFISRHHHLDDVKKEIACFINKLEVNNMSESNSLLAEEYFGKYFI